MTREEWIKAVRAGFDVTELSGPSSLDEFAARFVDRVILPALPVWRTMDSAPRDGSMFLGYQETPGDFERKMEICLWLSWEKNDGESGGFFTSHSGLMPTHWMPLPTPPEGK